MLLFQRGDPDAALRDLDRALGLGENVTARYNRERILQSQKRWREAIADYTRALELEGAGLRDAAARRGVCQDALSNAPP